MMFNKIVTVNKCNLTSEGYVRLKDLAKEVIIHTNCLENEKDIVERIGDADAILVSYQTQITASIIDKCCNLKYIGMCCSLYDPKSANVDIEFANSKNIVVKGIRDYGDEGVSEYVVYELTKLLHGYGDLKWENEPVEFTDLKVGIVGLGTSGTLIARTMKFFGADVSYFSRSRKLHLEEEGFTYTPLHKLLAQNDCIFLCLNKNVILLKEEEFALMKGKKIIFNTSIGPGHDPKALKNWLLESEQHFFFCDTFEAAGDREIFKLNNARSVGKSSGVTKQAFHRLSNKVINNILDFFKEQCGDM